MTSIEDSDYYGMEDFLSDSNLRLLTNDWPGNDPLSNASNESQQYSYIENYMPMNHDNFTPSSDSGNHSPTSSTSDGNGSNVPSWSNSVNTFTNSQADSPPEPVDLEAIESLLYDRKGEGCYYPSEYSEGYEDSNSSEVFHQEPYNSNSEYPLLNSQVYYEPQNRITHPTRKISRPGPYTITRPIRSVPTTSAPVTVVPVSSEPPPTPTVSNVTFIPQPQYVITTTGNGQNMPLQGKTILVPANVLPIAPVKVKKEENQANEEFIKKSEERRRRNRESAQVSRERKKMEFDQMKSKISELEAENQRLKQQLAKCTCNQPRIQIPNKMNSAKAIGMSVLALCAIIALLPTDKINPSSEPIVPQIAVFNDSNSTSMIHIRSNALFPVDDYDYSANFDSMNSSRKDSNSTSYQKCANGYLNTTELLKVNTDLINWINRHEKMNLVQLRAGDSPYLIYNSQKQLIFPEYGEFILSNSTDLMNVSQTVRRRGEWRRRKEQNLKQKERTWRHINMIGPTKPKPGDNALAKPSTVQEQIMKQLAAQLKQNDDTLYLMALKDYIILPRAATKPGESPKVSLILPALSLNSSMPNHIPMMRIECTIDRDVRRLRPEIQFFQMKTNYPLKSAARINLAKRLNKDYLVADNELQDSSFISSTRASTSDLSEDPESEYHWQVVERLLFIYSKVNPGVKYVQGMNELIGPIYFVFATDPDIEWAEHAEADTFYCFQHLMSEIKDNFIKTLDKSNCGIEVVLNKFYERLQAHDLQLYKKIAEEQSIKPQFYAFRWILLLLSQEFSLPDLITLWDAVFSSKDRLDFVQYLCLVMLDSVREELLNGDFSSNVRLLQNFPDVDVAQLIIKAHEQRNNNVNVVSRRSNSSSDASESSFNQQNTSNISSKTGASRLFNSEKISAFVNGARAKLNNWKKEDI